MMYLSVHLPAVSRFGFIFLLCNLPALALRAQTDSVVMPGATLELLADGFGFTEGPASDSNGNVYFTDQPNNIIYVWTTAGKLETFLKPAGRSNGLFFDPEGNLLACADENNELWSIDKQAAHKVLVKDFDGAKLNGPNDLWIHPDGSIYFTDPYYKRPYWSRGDAEQPVQAVYRLSPDRTKLVRLTDDLKQPNGIIGNTEGNLLYVADIGDGKTYRYDIDAEGALTNKTLFCNSGSDGMTLDSDGNVYLTGNRGVTRYSSDGQLREVIAVPKRWTANVTFGGAMNSTLFITASDSLFAIETSVQGCR